MRAKLLRTFSAEICGGDIKHCKRAGFSLGAKSCRGSCAGNENTARKLRIGVKL